jgi:glycine oxidase
MDQSIYHIAIAGAGIMGLTCAHTLVSAGFTVSLYDPDMLPPRQNASALAGGMLAPYSEIDLMSHEFITSGLQGISYWRQVSRDLHIPDSFLEGGSLLVSHPQDKHLLDRFARHLPKGTAWDRLDHSALAAIDPMLAAGFKDSLFLKEEAAIDPQQILRVLSTHLLAQNRFTFISEAADIRTIAKNHDLVLDCRGFGAAPDQPELRGVKGEVALVRNPDFELRHIARLMHPRYPLYIVPRADHHFLIGATQIESGGDCHVSVRSAMELLSALYSLHPSFGDAEIVHIQAGIRPAYPDNLPRIIRDENVISCNGLFRHGYLLSPVIAQAVADMILDKVPPSHFCKKLFGEAA